MVALDSRERVTFRGITGKTTVETRVDSGAARTSIDHRVARRVGAGPVVSSVTVNGEDRRSVATVWVQVRDFDERLPVSLSDRAGKDTDALLARDVLGHDGVTVDVSGEE